MGTTFHDSPSITYTEWQNARSRANDSGAPFHQPWEDFERFVWEVGLCPPGGNFRLSCKTAEVGYVPGRCYWGKVAQGSYSSTMSFAECPVAVKYFKEGLFDESVAVALACIDADVEIIKAAFLALDAETKGRSARFRRAAFGALVVSMEYDYGVVPHGEPSRWEISSMCAAIRKENYEMNLDSIGFNPMEEESIDGLPLDLEYPVNVPQLCLGLRKRKAQRRSDNRRAAAKG